MWHVENTTPFEAAGNWTRDRDGAEVWLVAVRCAFDIHPDGTTTVARQQEPPVLAPTFAGDPAASSMVSDSDFHLTKPTTDVLLQGQAHAPPGQRATRVDVQMRVGPLRKALRVHGDRCFERHLGQLVPGEPQPFERLPIVYERAAGGRQRAAADPAAPPRFDVCNPVGLGFDPRAGDAAPNIEHLGAGAGTGPAGFGPIAPHWAPRVGRGGTYDEAWRRRRMPLYPDDLDDRFFLCAPDDQRPPSHLRGGEPVELLNLSPHGPVRFLLPRVAFRCETLLRGKPAVVHRGALHSVILQPDRARVVLVWQSALRAHADVHRLLETHVRQLVVLNPRPAGRDGDFSSPPFEEAL